jgi:hypothetical protein
VTRSINTRRSARTETAASGGVAASTDFTTRL